MSKFGARPVEATSIIVSAMDDGPPRESLPSGFLKEHRRGLSAGVGGLLVIGLTLGLVFAFVIDEPTPVHAGTTSSKASTAGIGPGTKVSNPPPAATPTALKDNGGLCAVPIRNHYSRVDWPSQRKCVGDWGFDTQLLTVYNRGAVPVFLNEWYAGTWHGETMMLPHQTITMPLWGGVDPSIWVGACWTGASGPGTCRTGNEHQVAIVDFKRMVRPGPWLMFVRDWNNQGIPAVDGSKWAAVNIGNYAVQLHWAALGRDKWLDLPPGQKIENIPPGGIEGRKHLGEGAVALVQLVPTPHETGTDLYRMVTPTPFQGNQRPAIMTWLIGANRCSAHLQNLGPERVRLEAWSFPLVHRISSLALDPGHSGTLNLRGVILITGLVGTQDPGNFTTIKALAWNDCP